MGANETFGKVWKKSAMIGAGWGLVSGIISLGTVAMFRPEVLAAANSAEALGKAGILVIIGFALLGLGILVNLITGYLAAKENGSTEMGEAAIAGLLGGVVFGAAMFVLNTIFSVLNVALGYTTGASQAFGLAAVIVGQLIGAVVGIPISAVIALVGGIIYTAIKK
ncbi:MAG: hypothetical protein HY544_01615 [Candidatus Diapherotrites archaeon]|uniref:Uncharacterized protein n=1 Tax=Candidatus Iainarchaeum sp. TaxID=3101447 RepID=A0A8T3YLK2_9ARCH|nr:hypothetical protein [Candidatus Diapherotrites archaeon]